jgi:hypothetical protein
MGGMRPVSVVRRPLFGHASHNEIAGEEEAVAAGLQRQSRLLSPLRTFVLQRSASGNTLQVASPPPRGRAAREGQLLPSSPLAASVAAEEPEQDHHHPLPDMPIKLGFRQRWAERLFLFSYVVDFVVGPVYDRVLLPRTGVGLRGCVDV